MEEFQSVSTDDGKQGEEYGLGSSYSLQK